MLDKAIKTLKSQDTHYKILPPSEQEVVLHQTESILITNVRLATPGDTHYLNKVTSVHNSHAEANPMAKFLFGFIVLVLLGVNYEFSSSHDGQPWILIGSIIIGFIAYSMIKKATGDVTVCTQEKCVSLEDLTADESFVVAEKINQAVISNITKVDVNTLIDSKN